VLDGVFGPSNYRNEVIWKRTHAHGSARRWGDVHDTVFFYTRSDQFTWNSVTQDHDRAYVESKYRYADEGGRYRLVVLTAPGTTKGESGQPWRGYDPTSAGRHWSVPRRAMAELALSEVAIPTRIQDQLDLLFEHGYIRFPAKRGGVAGVPEFKFHLADGSPVQDVVTDIPPINSQARERLGYPTQKPAALLERIVAVSSSPGDVVLDPFCGCGTALVAAQKLGRRWIGIDITYLAVGVMRRRLADSFPELPPIRVEGEPTEVEGARLLADQGLQGRYQFQWWALDLVGALPASGDHKKGADTGIDGRITFTGADGGLLQALVSVKSGKPKADDVRVLKAVCERESAAIGILVTLDEPTKPMRHEATIAGTYHSDVSDRDYPRIQILSVADLLERGLRPQLPPLVSAPIQRAAKVTAPVDQATLFGEGR